MGADVPKVEGIDELTLVGQGGFASVYRGHQSAFRRDVAVKVVHRSGLDADDRRRFERECQAMGALSNHPGIVTLYDAGFTADERPYLVMEYVASGTLHDRLATGGPLGWQEVAALGVRLAGALETAHRGGVLHRDIKPANVLRAEFGDQLADFGIARIQGGHETRSGVITASVAHAAPEILDGAPPSAAADVYALGSTLYEALSGRAAFVRDTDEGLVPLIRRVVTEPPPDLRARGVPAELATVIETAMAKSPADRYATAEEFGVALRRSQSALGVPVSDLAVRGGTTAAAPDADETRGVRPPGATPPVAAATARPPADSGATVRPVVPPSAAPVTVAPARRQSGGPGRAALIAFGLGAVVVLAIVGFLVFGSDDSPQRVESTIGTTDTATPAAGSTAEPNPDSGSTAAPVETAAAPAETTAVLPGSTAEPDAAPDPTEAPAETAETVASVAETSGGGSTGGEPADDPAPVEPQRNPAGYVYGIYERIEFAPGTSGTTVSGGVATGTVNGYLLGAAAGQSMLLSIDSVEANASFQLYRTDDAPMIAGTFTRVALPADGDYLVVVGSSAGNAGYDLIVEVVTPASGSPAALAGEQRNPGGHAAYGRYERVSFEPGTSSTGVDATVVPGTVNGFVVGAGAGQFIRAAIDSGGSGVGMAMYGPDDSLLGSGDLLETELPLDGDYLIVVSATGADPLLSVEIV